MLYIRSSLLFLFALIVTLFSVLEEIKQNVCWQELPDLEHYWPPVTVRCQDCRKFGRIEMVGIHTITDMPKYKWVALEDKMKLEDDKRNNRLNLRRKREFLAGLHEMHAQGVEPGMPSK